MWAADNRAFREPRFADDVIVERPRQRPRVDENASESSTAIGAVRLLAFSVVVLLSFGAGAVASLMAGGPSRPTKLIQAEAPRPAPPPHPVPAVVRDSGDVAPVAAAPEPPAPAASAPALDRLAIPAPAPAQRTRRVAEPAPETESATFDQTIDRLTEKSVRAKEPRKVQTPPQGVRPAELSQPAPVAEPVRTFDAPARPLPKPESLPARVAPTETPPPAPSVANLPPATPTPAPTLPQPSPAELGPPAIDSVPAIDLQAAGERTAAKDSLDQTTNDAAKTPTFEQAATDADQTKPDSDAAKDEKPERPGFFRRALDFVHIGD